ncbi:MAG: M50 family metallopeptidase [Odoribacteraceae bacterium]|jgi:putative peptide zinc metalloprotease protein|nr:M50 family metallopeptidase [Odoribacteraceae bacterium]
MMVYLENIAQISILQFETSGKTQHYVASFEDRHFEINESVARLIGTMQESSTLSEVSQKYRGENGRQYSEPEIEKIIERYIGPIFHALQTPQKHPFLFKIELLSQSTIEQFSNILKLAFNRYIITGLVLCITTLEIYLILHETILVSFGEVNLYVILGVILLLLLSSFVHEVGHASACRHYKIKHGGVGFGLYLTFPVFYTDVSETWKLKRRERLVVNMAGVYFQLILLIPFFITYFLTGNHIIKWFLLTVNIGFLITLNPFFKFDGYWIVSDLLGVSNLRKKSGELIQFFIKKLFKREIGKAPYLSQIKCTERTALIVYTVIVNLFFVFYFFFLIPAFIYRFYTSFPPLIEQLIYRLSSGQTIGFDLIQALCVQLLFMALIIYLLVRMLMPFLVNIKIHVRKKHAAE